MEKRKRTALAVGIVMLLVGMNLAAMAAGDDVLEPDVTKTVDPDEIYFGEGDKETTVTVEVTGDGGTSSTITPMDVVFAIDSSGSMLGNDGGNARLAAAEDFVDQMDDTRDQAGVVSWDDNVDFTFALTDDFDDTDGVKYWIDQVDSSGGTNLNVGLNAAIDLLDANTRAGTSVEAIIFLTDGQGTYTYAGSGGPASEAASSGYIIYSIGLNIFPGSGAEDNLEDMAVATGGAYYSSPSPANLADIYNDIFEEIVASTVPYFVNVTEVLQDYIILDEDSFNIDPDTIDYNGDGTTTLTWLNVGEYADADPDLSADETVTLTFNVRSAIYGMDLEVQVEGEAVVEYDDSDGNFIGSVEIPQAYIDVYPYIADLIAGGGNAKSAIDVGQVIIYNDLDYLYVKYVTEDGWYMTGTHMHVAADSPDGIPQTKNGNPIPGHFEYAGVHNPPVQEFEYVIPWDDNWEPGTVLYIAAHANVYKVVGYDGDGMPVYQFETAWGDGLEFEGRNWATYIEYEDP